MRMPPWSCRILAGLSLPLASALALAACDTVESQTQSPSESGCYVTGCSAELCVDRPDIASPCIYRAEFACYHDATCARQSDDRCGWTPTPKLQACLAVSAGAQP